MASIGRSGNLRAPTLQIGQIFCIGYSQELYRMISRDTLSAIESN